MNNRIHTTIILQPPLSSLFGVGATDIVPATKTSRIMLVREGARDVSVLRLSAGRSGFPFRHAVREGWTPTVNCRYACRTATTNSCSPAGGRPDRPATRSDKRGKLHGKRRPRLRKNAVVPHLFSRPMNCSCNIPHPTQYVYTIDGAAQTVRAPAHARCLPDLGHRKRGYHDGTRYVEVPMPKPQSVLDQIVPQSSSRPTTRACA